MKLFKKLAAAAISAVMVMGCAPAVFAAEEAVVTPISLNGKMMTFESGFEPVLNYDTVFVSADSLFAALGAELNYDAKEGVVKAVKGGTTAEFKVGETAFTVTSGTEKITSYGKAPIVKNGKVYVPVRDAANSLGAYVNWDSLNKAVVIMDKDSLLGDDTYAIMDKYLAYSNKLTAEKPIITGKLNFKVTMNNDGETSDISGTCDLLGKMSKENMVVNTDIKLDLTSLLAAIEKDGELDEETKGVMESLKDFSFDFAMDMKTGMFYLSSGLLDEIMGAEAGTWYTMDLNSLMAASGMGVDFTALLGMADLTSYEDYMKGYAEMASSVNSVEGAAAYVQALDMMNTMFADKAFTKTGNTYKSTYTMKESGADMTMTMVLSGDDKEINGCTMDMVVKMEGLMNMTMNMNSVKDTATIKLTADMAEMLNMTMDGSFKYEATTTETLNAPAADSVLVPLM